MIGWKRKQDKLSGNQQLLRYSKAEKVARKRFKAAKKLLDQNNIELFYSEISQALFGYLEDKFHIPKSEFTLDRAGDELLKRNIKPELVEKMKTNAQKCEFIRFAPGTNPSQAMNEMYQSFSDVVISIERSICKMKKYLLQIILLAIYASAVFANTEINSLMQSGNELYKNNQYQSAIDEYNKLVKQGYEGTSLYYNLGNAHYRLGKVGFAILYYEKALKFSPGDEDTKHNLALAKRNLKR
ncbi:MAG: tetratricopeptide repeat protein [Ignavibacteriales bacterium]|nr:tetratricopeptide repeat protein [Ignavibacteriales bacterium]